jgi:exodeoxyribonuclease VII small subunit
MAQALKYLTTAAGRAKAISMSNLLSETDQNMNFEDALKALEIIVHKLESGEAPLDESIALYEQGHMLRSLCQKRLDAAKARIEAISIGNDGTPVGTKPFDAD